MAPNQPCAKYQYVLTPSGPQILPVPEAHSKDEESPADYNHGGYLQVKLRDTFKDSRYTVLRKLGWGHFSTVWLVKDNLENRHSALKVVKSASRYAETARDEIKLLRQVMAANPSHIGRDHVVSFLDSFTHTPLPSIPPSQQYGSISTSAAVSNPDVHICIVFEPLGENLLALIERHKSTGVPAPLVKVITKQVLLGLQYLHEECELVHTDIKPENIMISIPDVETHIQTELLLSPQPTSRKVGVPPKPASRSAVNIPKRGVPLSVNTSARQVQIFDSQPLLSPSSSSSWSSRSLFMGLTRLKEGDSSANTSANNSACPSKVPSASGSFIGSPLSGLGLSSIAPVHPTSTITKPKPMAVPTPVDLHVKQLSTDSEASMSSAGMAVSSVVTTSTPPSSVGSLTGALEKMVTSAGGMFGAGRAKEQTKIEAKGVGMKREGAPPAGLACGKSVLDMQRLDAKKAIEKELEEARCTCMFETEDDEDAGFVTEGDGSVPEAVENQSNGTKRRVPLPPCGPSLLSQTAPTDLHNHRLQCSTHSHSHSPKLTTSAGSSSSLLSVPSAAASSAPASAISSSIPSAGVPELSRSPSTSSASSPTPSANALPAPVSIKIADLGNATPIHKHYTEDIQTRQYRSPEAITGRNDWGATADVWSLACVVFELLTAEYLFDPQSQGELFGKDDDHCAQIIELLGPWPKDVLWGGRYSRDIFDSNGNLRYIRNLKPWPLKRVMTEKYGWNEREAAELCEFLLPMLNIDHHKRSTARDLLNHKWLDVDLDLELKRDESW